MRITTGMLNRNSGGLVPSRKSLLSYIKSNRTGGSSRLSALNAKSGKAGSGNASSSRAAAIASSASAGYTKTGYQRLEKAASSLEEQAADLGKKADAGTAAASDAESLVTYYNNTLSYLAQCQGSLNNFYRQNLKQAATDNLDALKEIGVSYGTDGRLSLDRSKFGKADQEQVKAALGSSSSFIRRLSAVASRVSDNAAANAQTSSNRYNAIGNDVSSYFSRYNFLG